MIRGSVLWYTSVSEWWPERTAAVRRHDSAFGCEVGGRVAAAMFNENRDGGAYAIVLSVPLLDRVKNWQGTML